MTYGFKVKPTIRTSHPYSTLNLETCTITGRCRGANNKMIFSIIHSVKEGVGNVTATQNISQRKQKEVCLRLRLQLQRYAVYII